MPVAVGREEKKSERENLNFLSQILAINFFLAHNNIIQVVYS